MADALTVLGLPAFSNRARNPYNALLYAALRDRGIDVQEFSTAAALRSPAPASIVHVHWPESHLNHRRWLRALPRSLRLVGVLAAARRRGTKLVWTVHNVESHGRRYPRTEQLFWRAFLPLVDGWLALSDEGAGAAIGRWPRLRDRPHAVTVHGHYRGAYPDEITRGQARARLGMEADAEVVGFVGRIKPYKGVPELLDAFRALRGADRRLLVAGRVETTELAERLARLAERDDRVVFRPGVVADEELQVMLRACDLVVAPFTSILNSGSVLLALSFDRPVLVPALGDMPRLAASLGGDWVRLYERPLDAATLDDALTRAVGRAGGPDLGAFEWSRAAEVTERLYREVLHQNASRR